MNRTTTNQKLPLHMFNRSKQEKAKLGKGGSKMNDQNGILGVLIFSDGNRRQYQDTKYSKNFNHIAWRERIKGRR
jgi:hypothetical protein